MLYLVGLGLGAAQDITLRGQQILRSCAYIYLDSYTSILSSVDWDSVSLQTPLEHEHGFKKMLRTLEESCGQEIRVADRITVESAETLLEQSRHSDVALLVAGDPLSATTHSDLMLRCIESHVPVRVIHNTSIMTAVGITGLSMYNFGPPISIPFFTETWKPDSFYEKLCANKERNLHTLCLLDIKVKEPTESEMSRQVPRIWDPPRFMTVNQAIQQLLDIEDKRAQNVTTPDTLGIGLSRIGSPDQVIAAGPLKMLLAHDFGRPLHSLIIPCTLLSDIEKQILNQYLIPRIPRFK